MKQVGRRSDEDKRAKFCSECEKLIRWWNKSGMCSRCNSKKKMLEIKELNQKEVKNEMSKM